ncbi:MAG: ABC-F family ATP-binding cassette domain-containing protein [Simkaniaceae bacterium]|nr:ABC-F family ATP-binding cassette domain-containing protein [Simkaniaceae bacterium]MCF7852215.1 ABC-F family ATP-binding cassette domain-containing protein [Simkaniaceae bacterium]
MTLFLNCQSISKAYGSQILFEGLSLSIFSKDRIGLIGPNGAGKSTLMKILAGIETPDEGVVSVKKELRIGYVPQMSHFKDESPVNVLLEALRSSSHLSEHEKLIKVETWLTKVGFTGHETSAEKLSGGWKKRLSIAQAMLQDPDVLMLDEPTNHLDLDSICWLEGFVQREVSTFILVSHDRTFLKNITNRMVEINPLYPQGLFSVEGSYDFFLEKKDMFIEGQIQQERSIATKVRRETDWLRQSPKARTTKSNARIDQAHEIFSAYDALKKRNRERNTQIGFEGSERQTQKLLVCNNLKKEMDQRILFQNLDITLTAGMKLGLMGSNGSGKTTLMRIFAGELKPDQGTMKPADDLKIVYFDQHRAQLPSHMTLKEALSPGGDFVYFQGKSVHVNGWCKRFLFRPEDLEMPIELLSGGERARLSIARLMLTPADILLLDEPTNDLDIPTLETLEENLMQFPGAVVLISHDRSMLDHICNLFLSLGDPGGSAFYAEYTQWEAALQRSEVKKEAPIKKPHNDREERKEKGRIEKLIEKKEKELVILESQLSEEDPVKLQEFCEKIAHLKNEINQLFERWAELETKLY